MKIALVIERMDVLRGGREIYTARLASALAQRGHPTTILCQHGSWTPDDELITIKKLGHIGLIRGIRLREFAAAVDRETPPGQFDIVHAMLPIPSANVYHPHGGTVPGSAAGHRRRQPRLLRPAANLLGRFNSIRSVSVGLERQIVAERRAVCVCVSEMIVKQFQRYYGQARTRVAFNGVVTPDDSGDNRARWRKQIRSEMGVGDDGLVLLTVATNFELKGVAEEIKAFAAWHHSGGAKSQASLIVVGRDATDHYGHLAQRCGVDDMVRFVGPTEDIFQWYAAADAMVLLTWYDPCSLTVLEAAKWGIPSLTTRFNGAAEAFGSPAGAGCLIVDSPRHKGQIVQRLNELADPVARQRHAQACRERAEYLSLDRHVDDMLAIYAEITGDDP